MAAIFWLFEKNRPDMNDRSLKGETLKKINEKPAVHIHSRTPLPTLGVESFKAVDPRNRAPAAEIVLSLCQAGGALKHQVRHRQQICGTERVIRSLHVQRCRLIHGGPRRRGRRWGRAPIFPPTMTLGKTISVIPAQHS